MKDNEELIFSTLDGLENSLNDILLGPLDNSKNFTKQNPSSTQTNGNSFLDELESLESEFKKSNLQTNSTKESFQSSIEPTFTNQNLKTKMPLYTDFSAPIILPSRSIKVTQLTTFDINELMSAYDEDYKNESKDDIKSTTDIDFEKFLDEMSEQLDTVSEKVSERNVCPFSSFEEFVLDEKLSLVKSFSQTLQLTEATKTCISLVFIFYKHGRSIEMIEKLICSEVSLQKSSSTLFRNNSITTHMMTSFTKLLGRPFLKSTIGPVIIDVFDKIDQGIESFEIDPEKILDGEDLQSNIASLKKLIHAFFDHILNSRSIIPKPFLEICGFLQKYTLEKFPSSRYAVIGGFIFLRFICPAIVAPDGYKIVDSTVTEKQRRCLILVSKVLQTVANEREFGDKESYMICMNPLITEYQSALQYFFNQLAKPVSPLSPDNTLPISITQSEYKKSMIVAHEQAKILKTKLLSNAFIMEDERALEAMNNLDSLPLLNEVTPENAPNRRNAISKN